MKLQFKHIVLIALILCLPTSPAWAWYGKGHVVATQFALAALPDDVPPFFREGGELVVSTVVDPDTFARGGGPWELRSVESQEHFFDLEFFTKAADTKEPWTLPATRFEFLEQCYGRNVKPYRVGLAPYAIMEWTQRLTVAFAEHRRWPEDKAIQQKCLVYAGFLAHYAQDICQPLHTTISYDGRVEKPSDPSPRTGIHNKVDSLIGRLDAKPTDVLTGLNTTPLYNREDLPKPPTTAPTSGPTARPGPSPLLQAVMAQIEASHKLVGTVYELEESLPDFDYSKPLSDTPAVHDFALERLRETTRFTASLFLTAWRDSEFIEIPAWHRGEHE